MSEEKTHIIIAPHCDDEIIGCYEVLLKEKKVIVIYTENVDQNRREESLELKKHFDNVGVQLFLKHVPSNLLNKDSVLYFPSESETHPAHRKVFAHGEELARKGLNVIFYTTNMQPKWIHEVEIPEQKKQLLDIIYPSQKSLWEFDHKYFLFEGRCSWLFN